MPTASSRRGSTYARGPAPRRGGGGNNLTAIAIAAVVVVGVIVAVVAMSGKKSEPQQNKPVVAAPPPVQPPPTKPGAPAYPDLPPGKYEEARNLVASFSTKAEEAKKLIEQSRQAKAAGNDEEWQNKLKAASSIADEINEKWNAFESSLPTTKDYDFDAVAAHYFKRERGQVDGYVKDVKRSTKTDERIR